MLLDRSELEGIAAGRITLAFRRWRRPTVRAGGTLRTPAGVLAIEAVDVVEPDAITEDEARAAGHPDRRALLDALAHRRDGRVHRVRLRLDGPDPRVALRERGDLPPDEAAQALATLDGIDRRGRGDPWTRAVLERLDARPGERAAELAEALGRETASLKRDVRRLKELGLTESLPVGYRLSPRGATVLAAARRRDADAPR